MSNREKIDFKKEFKEFYGAPKKRPVIVEVPTFKFLMIDGQGEPGVCRAHREAIEALFGAAYKVKFTLKKEQNFDYTVMPLEGLWWADDMADFENGNKRKWKWTMMIMQPEPATEEMVRQAATEIQKKKDLPALSLLRLEAFKEGSSAQILHVGSFADEYPNILRIHDLIDQTGGWFEGRTHKHHEIYLSDFRKTAPEKLRTILRQSFVKTGNAD